MKARSKVVAATILVAAVWLLVLRTSAVPFRAFTREDLEPEQPPSADRPVLHKAQAPRAEATRPRSAVPTTVDTTPPTAETQHAKSLREKIRAFFIRFGQRFDLALGLRKNAADAEAFVDQLCAESRILRERPLFRAPQGYERDAAPFLVPLIGYEKPLDYPPGQLQLMDELRTHLKSYGSDWLTKITDQDLAGVDFSWMAMLKQFDHWSMLGAGRLGDVPAGDLFRDPLLNYYDLTLWSKLRFAMGLRRGDLLAASAEVRHVADLMRS